jgi:hypothetical protein
MGRQPARGGRGSTLGAGLLRLRVATAIAVALTVAVDPNAGLASAPAGDKRAMIGVAIGLIIVGIVFLFVVPWVGIAVGVIGLILLIGFLLGFGRVPRRRNVSDRST